eukprot:3406943-Rhodomonas_salina.1
MPTEGGQGCAWREGDRVGRQSRAKGGGAALVEQLVVVFDELSEPCLRQVLALLRFQQIFLAARELCQLRSGHAATQTPLSLASTGHTVAGANRDSVRCACRRETEHAVPPLHTVWYRPCGCRAWHTMRVPGAGEERGGGRRTWSSARLTDSLCIRYVSTDSLCIRY